MGASPVLTGQSGCLTKFDRIEVGDTQTDGVLLRRRASDPGVTTVMRQRSRLLCRGWLVPGDSSRPRLVDVL